MIGRHGTKVTSCSRRTHGANSLGDPLPSSVCPCAQRAIQNVTRPLTDNGLVWPGRPPLHSPFLSVADSRRRRHPPPLTFRPPVAATTMTQHPSPSSSPRAGYSPPRRPRSQSLSTRVWSLQPTRPTNLARPLSRWVVVAETPHVAAVAAPSCLLEYQTTDPAQTICTRPVERNDKNTAKPSQ